MYQLDEQIRLELKPYIRIHGLWGEDISGFAARGFVPGLPIAVKAARLFGLLIENIFQGISPVDIPDYFFLENTIPKIINIMPTPIDV